MTATSGPLATIRTPASGDVWQPNPDRATLVVFYGRLRDSPTDPSREWHITCDATASPTAQVAGAGGAFVNANASAVDANEIVLAVFICPAGYRVKVTHSGFGAAEIFAREQPL